MTPEEMSVIIIKKIKSTIKIIIITGIIIKIMTFV